MHKNGLSFAILISFFVIVFLTQSIAPMLVAEANPFTNIPMSWSPESGLYLTPNVGIYLEYSIENQMPQINSFSYSLDNKSNSSLSFRTNSVNITVYNRDSTERIAEATKYTVSETLKNLADGNHTIAVYAYFADGTVKLFIDAKVTIDTTLKPNVAATSPQNQTTYNTKEVPLTYTTNTKLLWSYYSLDSRNNSGLKNFSGNTTLPSLSEGKHELNVYLTTNVSKTDSAYQPIIQTIHHTIIFYINTTVPTQPTTTPPTEPFPDPTQIPEFPAVLATTFLVAAMLAVSVIFRRKTKHE